MKLLFFLILINVTLNAALVDHFKKIEGKDPALHGMKNIDFIYMINLDERPEKYQRSLNQLQPYGVTPYRFSAVNGWKLSLADINDVGVKYTHDMDGGFLATSYLTPDLQPIHSVIKNLGQTYFVHCFARGTIGIALSHLSILQDAYDSGYETIWVMEDDIKVVQDPNKLSELIDRLDAKVKDWDILFTNQDIINSKGTYTQNRGFARRPNFKPTNPSKFAMRTTIDSEFLKIGARFGAHSMIVRRSGMEKLLNFFKTYQIYLPYDIDYYLPEGIQLYALIDDVVANIPGAASDNGVPSYERSNGSQNSMYLSR